MVTGMDHLFSRILQNPAFDLADEVILSNYLAELNFWSSDLRDLRHRQLMLETTSIYFADKYSRSSREREIQYQQAKHRSRKSLREDKSLKGEALEQALYADESYTAMKRVRDSSDELEAVFDKLYWMTVRKHERIRDQQSQDARQGG
jgi:hypothetical protein